MLGLTGKARAFGAEGRGIKPQPSAFSSGAQARREPGQRKRWARLRRGPVLPPSQFLMHTNAPGRAPQTRVAVRARMKNMLSSSGLTSEVNSENNCGRVGCKV